MQTHTDELIRTCKKYVNIKVMIDSLLELTY